MMVMMMMIMGMRSVIVRRRFALDCLGSAAAYRAHHTTSRSQALTSPPDVVCTWRYRQADRALVCLLTHITQSQRSWYGLEHRAGRENPANTAVGGAHPRCGSAWSVVRPRRARTKPVPASA